MIQVEVSHHWIPFKLGQVNYIDHKYSNILSIQISVTDATANGLAMVLPPELNLVHKDNIVTVYATAVFRAFEVKGRYNLNGTIAATPITEVSTFEGRVNPFVVITSFNFADKDTNEGSVEPDLQAASFHKGKEHDAKLELDSQLASKWPWFDYLLTTTLMNYMENNVRDEIYHALRELMDKNLAHNKEDLLSALKTVVA